jgi:hypothetical protein
MPQEEKIAAVIVGEVDIKSFKNANDQAKKELDRLNSATGIELSVKL